MNFSILDDIQKNWRGIRVIGRTIERDGRRCHILGMTLDDIARIYILEPADNSSRPSKTKNRSQRLLLKQPDNTCGSCLHCCEIRIGSRRLRAAGGQSEPLALGGDENYSALKLFCDMLNVGWIIPDWLKELSWDDLMLVTLEIPDVKRLPVYSETMPITIVHDPCPVKHIVEKTVTLQVGKPRTFHFTDHLGNQTACYINQVVLIDVWKKMEQQFQDPRYTGMMPEEQLQAIRQKCFKTLRTNCPKGMCYIGIEYECDKDLTLQFYTKEFLSSRPETAKGSAAFLMMHHKPGKKYGAHGLPLKGCVLQTPVSPDTATVPSELLFYWEKADKWEETVT